MFPTTAYNGPRGGVRRFNLTTKKNGVVRPNYTYQVTRPYTPRALPNITSSLASRWGSGKEQKFFHTHQPVGSTFNGDPNTDLKEDGYFIPLLQRVVAGSGSGSGPHAPVEHYLKCGAGPSERIGLKVTLKKIKLHGNFEFGSHSNNVHGGAVRYRLMIIEDKQANGATLNHANTTQLLQTADVDSLPNPVYASKFKILWDRTFDANQTRLALAGGSGMQTHQFSPKTVSFSVDKNINAMVTYQGTTGAMSEIVHYNYYLFVIASADTGGSVGDGRVDPKLYYEAMLYFDDN